MTADEVLQRYRDEELPEFAEMRLTDVNQAGNFGNSPLQVAAVRGLPEEVLALLNGGAIVDARGEHGFTALHHAVGQGHLAIVHLLLQHGATSTLRNDWGDTAFDIAQLNRRQDIAAALAPSNS